MKRGIILDQQITESSAYHDMQIYKGFNARLDGANSWCSSNRSTLVEQWVKVDLRYPMSIRGISTQGDPKFPSNFIRRFTLRYSIDGATFLNKTGDSGSMTEVGSNC